MRGSAPHPVVKKGCFNMCFLAPPVAGAAAPRDVELASVAAVEERAV